MIYTCIIHEVIAYKVTVDADSEHEAMDSAEYAHRQGDSVYDGHVRNECVSATKAGPSEP